MVDSAAACAWGGCRGPLGGGSRRRTRLASLASSDDPDPAVLLRRIHVRGVVESPIYPWPGQSASLAIGADSAVIWTPRPETTLPVRWIPTHWTCVTVFAPPVPMTLQATRVTPRVSPKTKREDG